jgi:AAA family ATP:ADP antiporter
MLGRLLQRLGVRPRERRLVVRFGLVHFALIASYTLARAVRDAVFLETLTARNLPYLYVGVAVWTALVSAVLARLPVQQTLQHALAQLLVVGGAALAVFGALLQFAGGAVTVVAFYLWAGAFGLILVSMFWVLVNEASDPREARRLFGIIGACGILGGMAGGSLATIFGGMLGPEFTLLIAGALLIGIAPLARYAVDPNTSRVIELQPSDVPPPHWRRDRYVLLLTAVFLAGGIAANLVDYQFKVALEQVSGGNAMRLTRNLGFYYTGLNVLAILLQMLASGWLLRRLGATTVASFLPGGVALGSLLALLVAPGALLVALTRTYEAGLRVSLARTAWEFLYFPLAPGLRRRVRTWIEAVVDRAAEAVSGIVILALGVVGFSGPRRLAAVTFAAAAGWLALSWRLRSAYVEQLSASLRTMVVDDTGTSRAPEAHLIEGAQELLDSTFEKRVLYGFDLLERLDPERLDRELGRLQDHASPVVRARALARLADPARPVASPLLSALAHDESVEVRNEAFRLYAERYADAETQMQNMLASSDDAARAAALTYLVSRSSTPESEVEARADVVRRQGTVMERRGLAVGLGRRAHPSPLLRMRLADLLHDPDADVRREALAAGAASGARDLVPVMLPLLASPATRTAARAALARFGNRIVGALGDALGDAALPIAVRRELPAVLADIGSQEAANELLRVPNVDPILRFAALRAQNRIRARSPHIVFPRPAVHRALSAEVETFLRMHLHLEVWEHEAPSRSRKLLLMALQERRDAAFERIFRRLGLLYPAEEIFLGYRALADPARRTRAQAIEYLDSVLLPEDRRLLVPILDEPDRRALFAESLYRLHRYTRDSSLAELARGADVWLQACALYVIGALRVASLAGAVRDALDTDTALVRETAAWSLKRLESA